MLLSSVLVELELVPMCLVSDTDIEATISGFKYQMALRKSSRLSCGDCITMVSQSVQQFVSHEYYKNLGRMSVM